MRLNCNMDTSTKNIIKIDATGKAPGRLASEIAVILQGKHRPDYKANVDGDDIVEVTNVVAMKITGKNKLDNKLYRRHSGHPGGLKEETLRSVFEKDPGEVLRRAVKRMMSNNKLRKERMKRLIIK
jgi:large subunit ribosomal protein L13